MTTPIKYEFTAQNYAAKQLAHNDISIVRELYRVLLLGKLSLLRAEDQRPAEMAYIKATKQPLSADEVKYISSLVTVHPLPEHVAAHMSKLVQQLEPASAETLAKRERNKRAVKETKRKAGDPLLKIIKRKHLSLATNNGPTDEKAILERCA